MKTINVTLNSKSINGAIRELREYKKWLKQRNAAFSEKLAEAAVAEAQRLYALAADDGNTDVEVIGPIAINGGFKVIAGGTDVIFAEFGAGGGVDRNGNYKNVPAYVADGSYSKANNGPYSKTGTWSYGDKKYSILMGFPMATHAMSGALDKAVSSVQKCADECFRH